MEREEEAEENCSVRGLICSYSTKYYYGCMRFEVHMTVKMFNVDIISYQIKKDDMG
jgi:hypothetical protein